MNILKSFAFEELKRNKDPLLRLHGVYAILIRGRFYIGSTATRGGFLERFRGHIGDLKNRHHKNPALQNIVNKHGLQSMVFAVLELSEREKVRVCEMRWITKFQKGKACLNVNTVANERWTRPTYGPAILQRLAEKAAKPFALEFGGKVFSGTNLTKFCRPHGLHQGAMTQVLLGKKRQFKGWTLPGNGLASATLLSPDGKEVEVPYFKHTAFARSHHLNACQLGKLIRGVIPLFKGWRLKGSEATAEEIIYSATRTDAQRRADNSKKAIPMTQRSFVVFKGLEKFQGMNRSAFCREHGLRSNTISQLERGDSPCINGFTLTPRHPETLPHP